MTKAKLLGAKASKFSIFLYRTALFFYKMVILIASIVSSKAKLWLKGRCKWEKALNNVITNKKETWVWFHAASLGEFEQARPLIESYRNNYPCHKIVLSFFSPSGYEIQKKYKGADYVCYLPLDHPQNAKKWVSIIQPKAVFFIKYEFWYFYLINLKQKNIPVYLVSAVFREHQLFFKPFGGLFREMLTCYEYIFVQDLVSKNLITNVINGVPTHKIVKAGDTRLDRVLEIREKAKKNAIIDQFVTDKKVLVIGSSWDKDEKYYIPFLKDNLVPMGWKIIIAPHKVDFSSIKAVERRLDAAKISHQLYSTITQHYSVTTPAVLIIDNIGMLSSLYSYANLAYIGGGFGEGIHNILEAAVFEIPVLFGPKHKKFVEAQELLNLGAAFEINKTSDFEVILNQLNFKEIQKLAKLYFNAHPSASNIILNTIKSQFSENI